MRSKIKTQVVVIGAGPAGYTAAFRCADLGLETLIVERYNTLGGVCLNVGCIPSKTLLHITKIIEETSMLVKHGIYFNHPKINIDQIRSWKEEIICKLTQGLSNIAYERKIKIVNGLGKFLGSNSLVVENENSNVVIEFNYAIVATGSYPVQLPNIPYHDSRVWNSTDALSLKSVPQKILVIGGGIIGIELATVYHALGSSVNLIEISHQIIPNADQDIACFFEKSIGKKIKINLKTSISSIEAKKDGLYVSMKGPNVPDTPQYYDVVLIAVGRVANSKYLDIEKAGIVLDDKGFICVDKQLRTNIPHIFAIGDIVGDPMLAHKGIHEGIISAEVIAGMQHYFDPKVIPFIVYSEPELAWVGLTEKQAKEKNINFEISTFPWSASGRAITACCSQGITKLIIEKNTHRIIGGAIVGSQGGEIIGEIGLAIEMGCYVEDLALTIHAHPTLYETIGSAAKVFNGTITDILSFKIKK